jgi:protein-tyrosine phosphatase
LLLYALGVPYETIRQDYEATNYYRAADNDKTMSSMVNGMHIGEPVVRAMMSANGVYLDATFEAIRTQYGSIDRYLADQLGLDQQAIVKLRGKYLE